ncbi:MAG TPA: ribonuclease P protein component [Bacteroidia bacterium]|nr:ribonuclease P protein component [Bacteroidia bacterium]HRS59374.1 ribonuclease P protein component [Bacteroidia bacterium]HRU68832.1 ribonuclease P protein component [Bacteroidia bacterium]
MHGHKNTFSKKERLCRKKIISQLINGEAVTKIAEYPLLLVFKNTELPEKVPAQVMFGVSRKSFKKAVDRNYLKRLLREVYRTNKHLIYSKLIEKNMQAAILIVYTPNIICDYQKLQKSIVRLFEKFNQHIA